MGKLVESEQNEKTENNKNRSAIGEKCRPTDQGRIHEEAIDHAEKDCNVF